MTNFDNIEEKTEINLSSKQILSLSFGFIITSLMIFLLGFYIGKKNERRRIKLDSSTSNEDLLSKLDKYEAESKRFVAKSALTSVRKREMSLGELDSLRKEQIKNKVEKPRVREFRSKHKKIRIALAKIKKHSSTKIKIVKKSRNKFSRKTRVASKRLSGRRISGRWKNKRRRRIALFKTRRNRFAKK